MIKNYLMVTFRNFVRNINYSLINIIGLSIGITACIIIFLIIRYELSFDKFNQNYNSIYRIVGSTETTSGTKYQSTTPYPFAKSFRNDFPEIPFVTQLHFEDEVLLRIDDHKQKIKNVLFADSLFFDVFKFKVLSGNPRKDLAQPGKVFLTKSLADKILKGKENVTIKINNKVELQVVGIIADPPPTSHINFTMVASMSSFTSDFIGGFPLDRWGMVASGLVYMSLPDKVSPASVEERLVPFVQKYFDKEDASRKAFTLQPLKDIHFNKQYTFNPGPSTNADTNMLITLSIIGGFMLFIASINFINLSTALAIKKSKEIGIRKTLGAKRSQLTAYFLGETFLLTVFSVLISLGLVELILPLLNNFLEKEIERNLFTDPGLLVFLLILTVTTTILSGFYPAIILSGFNPIAVLKNKISAYGSSGAFVRKVLVVFQFIIAHVLIISTLIIADQMQYFKNKPLGFDEEAVINVPLPENSTQILEQLRTRLEVNSDIENLSFSFGAPTSENNFSTGFFLTERGPTDNHDVEVKPVDIHYLETYGIKLVAGRWFQESEEKTAIAKQKYVYILNESAVKKLAFSSPEEIIGKFISTGVNDISAEVIGVVEDFHTSSLHEGIKPVVLINFPYFYYDAGIKVNASNFNKTIDVIEKEWTALFPDYNFEYQFLDESLAKLYREDERTFTLFKVFAAISIFIGCLGLYGLVSYMANQKLKEVGIRKVMGATTSNIIVLFSKEFIRLIFIAFLIAAPLSWYFMSEWLNNFEYHIPIHWSVFIIGVVATLIIALTTVGYRAIKASLTNPVNTLRTE